MTDLLYYPLGELQEAVFVRRENRFRAEVELNGQIVKAHVPNSGRMQELLVSGAKVWVKPVKEDGTHKTYAHGSAFCRHLFSAACLGKYGTGSLLRHRSGRAPEIL